MGQKSSADSNPVTLAIETAEEHDDPVGALPITIAGAALAPADSAVPAQVSADGDQTRVRCDRDGAMFTHPHPPRIWNTMSSFTAAQSAAVIKAGTAGLSLFLKTVGISIPANTAAVTRVALIDSSTVTVYARNFPAAGSVNFADYIEPPIKLTVANSLRVTTTGTSATCDIFLSGFSAP